MSSSRLSQSIHLDLPNLENLENLEHLDLPTLQKTTIQIPLRKVTGVHTWYLMFVMGGARVKALPGVTFLRFKNWV